MLTTTFDPAKNLNLYFRRGRNGSKTFTFTSGGNPYNLTGKTFELVGIDGVVTVLDNTLTISVSDTAEIPYSSNFWELIEETTDQTWLCGTALFTTEESADTDEEIDISIVLNGEPVNIEINLIGGNQIGTNTISSAGDVTLEFGSNLLIFITELVTASGPKDFTVDREDGLQFTYIRTIDNIAAALDFGAGFQSGDARFTGNIYTPIETGKEKIVGTWDGSVFILDFNTTPIV